MIKQFRIAFGLKMGSSILTFRARQDANAPETSLEARWRDWPLTFFCQTFPKILQNVSKNVKIFVENWSGRGPYGFLWIRMDPYGSVWSLRTPWGLPGASWGPGGSKKGGKGVLTPGGAGGPSWVASLLALRGLIGLLLAYVGSSLIWPYGLLMVDPKE